MAAVKQAVQAMVTEKRAISADEAKAAMQDLFAGTASQAQTGAFLTSLQVSPHAPLHRLNRPPCSLGRDARIVCRDWLLQTWHWTSPMPPTRNLRACMCLCKQPETASGSGTAQGVCRDHGFVCQLLQGEKAT